MDFGFGAFLEKFEENFGKSITRILLILIGVAVFSTASSIIYNLTVRPIANLVYKLLGEESGNWLLVVVVAFSLTLFSAIVSLIAATASWISARHYARLYSRARGVVENAERIERRLLDTHAANLLLLEDHINYRLKDGSISQDEADLILSLAGIGLEAAPELYPG